MHYFGHLHEDAEEPIESSNNNEQLKENAQNASVVQRASRFDEQITYEEIFPDNSTAQHQVIFTTQDQGNSTAQDHAMDMNMEAVNEIVHNMREAIATIRNEGDILQVFAIENQGIFKNFSIKGPVR